MLQYLVVGVSLLCVVVRTVLTHTHTVTVAAYGEGESVFVAFYCENGTSQAEGGAYLLTRIFFSVYGSREHRARI